jgi:O-antigen ligase
LYDRSVVLWPARLQRDRADGAVMRSHSQGISDRLGVPIAGAAVATVLLGAALQMRAVAVLGALLLGLAGVLWTDLLPAVLVLGGACDVLTGGEVGVVSLVVGPLLLSAAWRFSRGRGVLQREWLVLGLMVACATLLSVAGATDVSSATQSYTTLLLLLLMATACWQFPPSGSVSARATAFEVLAAVFVFVSGFVALRFGELSVNNGRLTLMQGVNPNAYAIALAQVGTFILGYLTMLTGRAVRALAWLSLAACSCLIVLTGSRSSLVGLVAGSTLILFIWARQGHRWRQVLSLLIGATAGSIVGGRALAASFPALASRWSVGAVLRTGGSGRVTLWQYTLRAFGSRPILGFGIGGKNLNIAWSAMGVPWDLQTLSAHNIVLAILADVGLVGFVPLFVLCCAVLKTAVAAVRRSIAEVVPYFAVLVCSLAIGVGEYMYLDKVLWVAGIWTVVMATTAPASLAARVLPIDGIQNRCKHGRN